MRKFFLILIISIVALAGGVFVYLKVRKLKDFEPLIKERLEKLVYNATEGLYHIQFDEMDADITESKLSVKNIHFTVDSTRLESLIRDGKRPSDIFDVRLKALGIDGIDLMEFISNGKINLNTLYIKGPELEVYHTKKDSLAQSKDTASMMTLYRRVSKDLKQLSINKVVIEHMSVSLHNRDRKDRVRTTVLNDVSIYFDDILVDSTSQSDSTRFLYAKDANITTHNLQLRSGDSMYFFIFDSIGLNALSKKAAVNGFYVKPRVQKEEFSRVHKYVKDRYDVNFQKVAFNKIDWWNIVLNESFDAEEMEITKGEVHIYCDRRLLPNEKSKVGNYPHQLIKKISIPVNIDTIRFNDIDVIYEEFNPKADESGKLVFYNINAAVNNVTNDPELISRNPVMRIDARGSLMNAGTLSAVFNFDLSRSDKGVFSVDAYLSKTDLKRLNKVTEPIGLFKSEEGVADRMDIHLSGDNYNMAGNIRFEYHDLKISLLKKDEDDNNDLKKQGLLSFVANNFILKSDNPQKNKKVRTETMSFQRDINKSFFNFIWKTTLIGIMKTVGYDMGVKKVRNKSK